jgi:hypothetical protein
MKTTYEKTAEFLREGNKINIFNELYQTVNGTSGEVAETIAEFLRDCSTTFVSDVAGKYLKYGNSTEKQVWCMVFEAIKINHMIDAWIEKEIESINE